MSRWVDLDFRINFVVRVHGMVQLLLMKADSDLQLYISPVNWKPDNPPVPISTPASFAGDLFKQIGYYRTLGWAEATWPLNEGRMDEQTFMDDLDKAFDDRAQVILSRLERGQLGHAGRRDRVDRPRPAHDVAADGRAAPDVRRRAGRQVRRFNPARLPARRPVRRRGARACRSRARRS